MNRAAAAPKLALAKATAPAERPFSKPLVSHEVTPNLAVAKAEVVVKTPAAPKMAAVIKTVAAPKLASAPSPALVPAAGQPTAPALAEVQKASAFHFEIEGDDEIVDFDAGQKSLETSAGKTFFVNETLVASSVAGWLDEQANIHYRCDETSTCTLSLSRASTVLHATMRSHHNTLAQNDAPAMTLDSTTAAVGLESFGR